MGKILESKRIDFKEWDLKQRDLALKLWSNPSVCKYICVRGYFTEKEIDRRLAKEMENQKLYGVQYWPLFLKETDEFIGCCGLRPYDLDKGIYEIGIPDFRGKGLASEAIKRVIKYSFEELKANDLFAGHHPKNESSKKILTKMGFNLVGEEFYEPTGLMHPSYTYKKMLNKKLFVINVI